MAEGIVAKPVPNEVDVSGDRQVSQTMKSEELAHFGARAIATIIGCIALGDAIGNLTSMSGTATGALVGGLIAVVAVGVRASLVRLRH